MTWTTSTMVSGNDGSMVPLLSYVERAGYAVTMPPSTTSTWPVM
jgi:hypothetical protein